MVDREVYAALEVSHTEEVEKNKVLAQENMNFRLHIGKVENNMRLSNEERDMLRYKLAKMTENSSTLNSEKKSLEAQLKKVSRKVAELQGQIKHLESEKAGLIEEKTDLQRIAEKIKLQACASLIFLSL
jgi:septal ring factor EnvC (AmiA/AmiB activator)